MFAIDLELGRCIRDGRRFEFRQCDLKFQGEMLLILSKPAGGENALKEKREMQQWKVRQMGFEVQGRKQEMQGRKKLGSSLAMASLCKNVCVCLLFWRRRHGEDEEDRKSVV